MPENHSDNAHYPYDTNRVRELLKSHRKTRGLRSCFPCRHRKVRCDGHVPCASCVKRGHRELCRLPTEERPRVSDSAGTGDLGGGLDLDEITNTIEESQSQSQQPSTDPNLVISRLEKIEEQISALKAELRASSASDPATAPSQSPQVSSHESGLGNPSVSLRARPASKSPGRYCVEDATGATLYLGSHSDTPLALGCRQASAMDDTMLYGAMANQFVPRAYPFTSLWGPEATAADICETLPEDSDVIRYWQVYQTNAYPFYPVLVTLEEFGPALFGFLDRRFLAREEREGSGDEPNTSWLALLFAVLACGAYFSDDPIRERDLRSKVFICSSFHCLRLSNIFNRTDLNQIQAMALIGNCLRNNLDTNSAWILMGATIRMAQSIGLHDPSRSLSAEEQTKQNQLWWMLIWQDTFLSFTYDRPPSWIPVDGSLSLGSMSQGGSSFQKCVLDLCRILLARAQTKTPGHPHELLQPTLQYKQQIENLLNHAQPFLVDRSRCYSLQNHLERLALGIHFGYAICRLCQIYADDTDINLPIPETIKSSWSVRAMQVVECFLDLYRLSANVCRSLAFVHNAVSCAITLMSHERLRPEDDRKMRFLIERLIAVLEKEEKSSEWRDADTNVRYFGPYSRALKALREISSSQESQTAQFS
ncbi:Zn(II)2Cys6 transcription factor [Aspergillus steynii IBT 23096]|uniref:Zn(II)2Cys6 transcription factor n=1 Tax=Aspergillus steynii IBT 23096 TaxID=1392250 RepID=A0A2I2GBW7_9EURO|nr:Zn(II)2Cys6 transcription factor [Aspergillus steynii IBT 23096]PLB50369.1 Zn(II)2Cys6 transcription factor [Aspergillus steynii IBT 23096]